MPVLATVTVTVTGDVELPARGVTEQSDSAKVVYDSPNPKGNIGAMPRDWNQR